jgi:hypothetical protein
MTLVTVVKCSERVSCIYNTGNNIVANSFKSFNNWISRLQGNPVCQRANELNILPFCGVPTGDTEAPGSSNDFPEGCKTQSCPFSDNFEYVPESPSPCFCAAPLGIGLRLRSPSISDFQPYKFPFELWITDYLGMNPYQLVVDSFMWEEGPRLRMYLKIFPSFSNDTHKFNTSEILQLMDEFATFSFPSDDTFGPYDLLNFTLLGPYKNGMSLELHVFHFKHQFCICTV